MEILFQGPYFFGLGGRRMVLMYTLKMRKNSATFIKVLVKKGKFNATTEFLNSSPPIIKGSQPKVEIIRLAVAQLKFPSAYWYNLYIRSQNGARTFKSWGTRWG
jgi:hypothetical protein